MDASAENLKPAETGPETSTETLSPRGIAAMQGFDESQPEPANPEPANDWVDHGIIDVPVADLPMPEGVSSPADFPHHITWDDCASATSQLPQIQQEVNAGKTGDDFFNEDQAAKLDHEHGKKRIYDLYYGSDPVQVDKVDGQYVSINSGRHRVYAAKALGLETMPARVIEKKS